LGLLDEIPTVDEFAAMLAPIVGDASSGTGVAGALKLLESFDGARAAGDLSGSLGKTFSMSASVTPTADATGGFAQATGALSVAPADLFAPLADAVGSISGIGSKELPDRLAAAGRGLRDVRAAIPARSTDLLAHAAVGATQLQGELAGGALADLASWSRGVQEVLDELEPLFAGGPGTLLDRLIEWLRDKLEELVRSLVPVPKSQAQLLGDRLDAAVSPETVARLRTLASDAAAELEQLHVQLDGGDFAATGHAEAARTHLDTLTGELALALDRLGAVLASEPATASGLARVLDAQLAAVEAADVVDVGNVRKTFADAIGSAEHAVRAIDLSGVQRSIEEVLDVVDAAIDAVRLDRFVSELEELTGRLSELAGSVEPMLLQATAAARSVFEGAHDAIREVADALGQTDGDGNYRLHVVEQLTNFLAGVRTTLEDQVQPLLESFGEAAAETLVQVETTLAGVQAEIDTVVGELTGALQGVSDTLDALDVPATLTEMRDKLDAMLTQLGEIDFAAVVDPVIEETHGLRDSLKQIDPSSLNEITRGALNVSLTVVVQLDFAGSITNMLMQKFDELLQVPKQALAEVEAEAEGALQRFAQLAPDAVLEPLDTLFRPVHEALAALDPEALLAPLREWHEQVVAALDGLSPTALLQPLADAHSELAQAAASLQPAALVAPLQQGLDAARTAVAALDIGALTDVLREPLDSVRAVADTLEPGRILEPLASAFADVDTALQRLDPAQLLEPVLGVFDWLTEPLAELTSAHLALVAAAFEPLRDLSRLYDPNVNFTTASQKAAQTRGLLVQLDVGGLIATLRTPHTAAEASFDAGAAGHPGSPLGALLADLNPLRNAALGQTAAGTQDARAKLEAAFPSAAPPAELAHRYAAVKGKLDSLAPTWLTASATPESVRDAVRRANPLNVADELHDLHAAFVEKFRQLDPRPIEEALDERYERLKDALLGIDLDAIENALDGVRDTVVGALDPLDLGVVTEELEAIVGDLAAIVAALDPAPVAAELDAIAQEVRDAVGAISPDTVLAGLDAPLASAKAIVAAFDPAALKEPLEAVFESIQDVLAQVDVGVVLQPLVERLDQLREELRESLQATEDAFEEMLAAAPV
jgi:hypothetical protein